MSGSDDTNAGQLPLSNAEVGDRLNELAELLEAQNSNPFRVRAYRVAAENVRALREPVHQIAIRDGAAGLMRLPGIGESLARSIERLALSGKLALLDRLRGHGSPPERVFTTLSGIGPKLAARIHDELGIETLADLEAAAIDGRLARVPGMGQKKIRGVRESLAGRFRRRPRIAATATSVPKDCPCCILIGESDITRRYTPTPPALMNSA
jgi:DNA polymerase/3'-5' exonuclease PolX